uniref:Neur_chan_LBD domain-containing protein n=1 Tax=Panagrellus redivivus TaxID=6233 RepID=A0A7E4V8P7_PANRE
MQLAALILFLVVVSAAVKAALALTPEERGELARKFKYYHTSVRPGDKFNLVETLNGTFFNLNVEIELLQTRPIKGNVGLDMVIIVHYLDDRLVMRELNNVLTIPIEFTPWLPAIDFGPYGTPSKSVHVDPKTGQMTIFYRLHALVPCFAETWKYPFERYQCDINFGTDQDERIFVRTLRDLRPDRQISLIKYRTVDWPHMMFHVMYSSQWHSSIVNVFLPSILIFSVVIFAQWKRRKVQIMISVGAMIAIIIMQTSHKEHDQITMQDLWMSGMLIHIIAILTADLILPSRRIIHTTITTPNSSPATYVHKSSLDRSPLIQHSPATTIRGSKNAVNSYAYIGPGASEIITDVAPLASGESENDVLKDLYLLRSPTMGGSMPMASPTRRRMTEMTIGKKKKIALAVILLCYAIFVITYSFLVIFMLTKT